MKIVFPVNINRSISAMLGRYIQFSPIYCRLGKHKVSFDFDMIGAVNDKLDVSIISIIRNSIIDSIYNEEISEGT